MPSYGWIFGAFAIVVLLFIAIPLMLLRRGQQCRAEVQRDVPQPANVIVSLPTQESEVLEKMARATIRIPHLEPIVTLVQHPGRRCEVVSLEWHNHTHDGAREAEVTGFMGTTWYIMARVYNSDIIKIRAYTLSMNGSCLVGEKKAHFRSSDSPRKISEFLRHARNNLPDSVYQFVRKQAFEYVDRVR